jgi:SAM-dependent methyltransferase
MDTKVRLTPLASKIHHRCRASRWSHYTREFPPRTGERILDVGASPLVDLPDENAFLRRYPFEAQITAIFNDTNLTPIRRAFPTATVLTADALDLPFHDHQFDVVHSNAVIEHVGPTAAQARFLAEVTRVGRAGFVSTPSRWFPVDSHTNIPLAHWLPRPLFVATLRRIGRLSDGEEWITWLLSSRAFAALAPENLEIKLVRQRLAGITAVATLVFRSP